MTQDGDVRFELYEMPSKALVGRFTVSDAPTGSSMAANGVFCTREMVCRSLSVVSLLRGGIRSKVSLSRMLCCWR